jgi:hypothetical protein
VPNTRTIVLLSVATGVLLELGIGALGGRSEAWDSPLYWTMGLPVAVIAAATFGYLSHRSAWVGTLAIVPAQVMTMMVRSGEISGLWPLAVVLSSILSAPFVVTSFVASRFRPASFSA